MNTKRNILLHRLTEAVFGRCFFWYLLATLTVYLLVDSPKAQTNWLNQKQATLPELRALEQTGIIDRASLNEGLRYFRRWAQLNPNEGLLWGAIGALSFSRGDYGAAEDAYRKAIELDPAIYSHYLDLGMIYFYLGDFHQANILLNISLEQLRFFPELIDRLYTSIERLNLPESSLSRMERIIARAQQDRSDTYLHLADLYSRIADQPNFQRICNEAQKSIQPHPRLFYFLGLITFERKEYSEAIELFSQAITADPDYIEAYFYRGLSFKEINKAVPSRLDIQKATALKTQGVVERHLRPLPFTMHLNIDLLTLKYQGLLLKNLP